MAISRKTLIAFFNTIWTQIKTAFANVATWFKDRFTNAVNNIKKAFSGIGSFFTGIWSKVKSAFPNVAKWFGDKFGGAMDAIKKKFKGWGDYWSGLWEKVKEKFTGIGAKIGSAMSGAVKGALNKVIGKIESVINKGIGFINSAIGLANKLPGVNVSKLGKISLHRLATGGVLRKGEIGVLEGSGAEAVVPLEKNTQWIKRVADSMKTELALTRRQSAVNAPAETLSYASAVDAFKTALSEMQIVLDDETAGKFVERTVTRYIYA